jgi:hypothetical protein
MTAEDAIPFVHLYADSAGDSRFGEGLLPLKITDFAPPAAPFQVTGQQPASHFVVIRLPVGWGGDEPHPTPGRFTLFCLEGSMRVTTSSGDVRSITAGTALLMEDTHGKGHRTEVTSDGPVQAVMIKLP